MTQHKPSRPASAPQGIRLFPIDIGKYDFHEDLPVEHEVARVLETLAPFGVTQAPWAVPMSQRGSDAVNDRLTDWSTPDRPGPTFLYWLGHGWSDGQKAGLAHKGSPESITGSEISSRRVAQAIIERQGSAEQDKPWCVVVIEACKSYDIARLVLSEVAATAQKVTNVLVVGVSGAGGTNLGTFSHAFANVVTLAFGSADEIPLEHLRTSLDRALGDAFVTYLQPSPDATLVRTTPTAVAVALDGRAELNAAFAELPNKERDNFLAWGAHADLGEASWYVEGRAQERRRIVKWLGEAQSGMLVVTGKAGSGKSALLAETLINTWPGLREALVGREMIAPLPAAVRPADHAFQATLRMTGATFREVVERLGAIVNWDPPPPSATNRERLETLTEQARGASGLTVLVDSLDESQQPLSIAALLREVAASGGVRLLVGTRRSTLEAIDRPDPSDENILLTLAGALSEQSSAVLSVERDPEAIAGFVRERLRPVAHADVVERVAAALGERRAEFLYASLAVHEIRARLHEGELSRDALDRLLRGTHRQLFAAAVERISGLSPMHEFVLEALGLALGRGLPLLDGLLGSVAAALAEGAATEQGGAIDDEALYTLLDDAAPYVMIDTEDQQTVFRLAHRTYQEYYRGTEDLEGVAPRMVGSETRHRDIARRLIALARDIPGPLNPYLARHLTGHLVRATPGSWQLLADHPNVLDRLDPRPATADALRAMLDRQELPTEILGVVASKHLLAEGEPGSREGIRQIGMASCSTMRAFTREDRSSRWSVRSARLRPHPVHLRLRTRSDAYAMAYLSGPEDISLLAAGCQDGKVRLWAAASGEPFGDAIDVSDAAILGLCAYPVAGASPRLVTSDGESQIGIWDPLTGSCEHRFTIDNASAPRALAAYCDRSGAPFIVTDGDECTARVWSAETGNLTQEFHGHRGVVRAIACCTTAEETIIASAGQEDAVRLWNPASGAPHAILDGHRDWVKSLAPYRTPDGRPRLASGGDDAKILIWDLDGLLDSPAGRAPRHAQPMRRLSHRGVRVRALASYENRRHESRLASGGEDGDVRIWDPEAAVQLGHALSGHIDAVVSTVLSSAAAMPPCVASLGEDQRICIWDPRMAERLVRDDEQVVAVNALAASSSLGANSLATAGDDGAVRFWSPSSAEHAREPLLGHVGAVRAMTAYRDRAGVARIATVGADESLRISTPTERDDPGIVCRRHVRGVLAIASYTDGGAPRLATGGEDGQIWLWDATNGEPIAGPLSSGSGWVRGLDAYTVSGGHVHLAAVGPDRAVRLWDLAEPSCPLLMHGHIDWVLAVRAFTNAEGAPRIATAGHDATMRLWEPLERTEIARFDRGSAPIRAIDVVRTADGAVLLAGGDEDGVVWIWEPHAEGEPMKIPLGVPVRALRSFQDMLLVGTAEGHVALDIEPPSGA